VYRLPCWKPALRLIAYNILRLASITQTLFSEMVCIENCANKSMSMQLTKDSLKTSLVHMGREIYRVLVDPSFKLRTIPYVRQTATEIGVDKDGAPSGGVKWKAEIFERPWVENLPEDDELNQAIEDTINVVSQRYNLKRTEAELEVREFKSWIAKKAISIKFKPSVVDEGAQIFIQDLDNSPVSGNVKVFLLGVTPRRSLVRIGSNLLIRKVSKDDLTFEHDLFDSSFQKPRIPHSIAEINMEVSNRKYLPEHQFAAERLVSFLRLFRAWPVYLTSYSIIFPTISPSWSISDPCVPLLGIKRNIIEPEDENRLERLYQVLSPMLRKDIVYRSGKDPISIAFKLYSTALTSEEGNDWKLATTVAGLDALLITDEVGLKRNLARRAGKLLELLGEDPKQVVDKVTASYDVRSKVFHGDELEEQHIITIRDNLSNMFEYLRKTILFLLILNTIEGLSKKSIIDYIDNSCIGVTKEGTEMLMEKLRSTEIKLGHSYEQLGLKGEYSPFSFE